MRYLTQIAVNRPIAFCMLALTLLLFGSISWRDLDISLFPDIKSPTVMLSVQAQGKSAIEMERLYGEALERELFTIKGLKSIDQTAMDGKLVATVFFDHSVNFDMALIEVNRNISSIASDTQVDSVMVRRFDTRQMPIFVLGLTRETNQISLPQLKSIAKRQVVPALEQLPGVAEVRVAGGKELEVGVKLTSIRLAENDLTVAEVMNRIIAENFELQAGTVEFGEQTWLVKSATRLEQVSDIENITIKYRESDFGISVAVKVKDVADISMREANQEGIVRINGNEGIGLFVHKEGDANTVNVAGTLRTAIEKLKQDIPHALISVVADEASIVESSISDVETATIVGLVLATAVLTIFLRRPEPIIVVSLAIPVSLMATLFALNFAGYTLNLMTLGGLALGVGMLVDNAIVVIESIYRQMRSEAPISKAAAKGAGSVSGAITTSTLTTCVVFLPVLFIEGIAAKLMAGIAFTVIVSLLTSLLVAVFLIPALATVLIKKPNTKDIDPGSYWVEKNVYKLLGGPAKALVCFIGLLALAIAGLSSLGTDLLPPQDPKQFSLKVTTQSGQKVEQTSKVITLVEEIIQQAAQQKVRTILSEVGQLDDQKSVSFEQITRRENSANISVFLGEGSPSVAQIIERTQPLFDKLYQVDVQWLVDNSPLGMAMEQAPSDIAIEVSSNSIDQLYSVTEQLKSALSDNSELWNIRTSFEGGSMEYQLSFDRQMMAAYGVSLAELETNLQSALGGIAITTMLEGDENRSVVLDTATKNQVALKDIAFRASTGQIVRLGDIAQIELVPSQNRILRRDQKRIAELTALFASDADRLAVKNEVAAFIEKYKTPVGVSVQVAGQETERAKNINELTWAVVLSVLLVFMLLAGSFESFLQPFTVLASIPLALLGVALVIVPVGQPIGMMVMLGLVVLSGIAVNDAILLVQKAQQLMLSGEAPRRALAKASAKRLRPIIMTSMTTICALFPLALGFGESAQLRAPLALTVIGGLFSATVGSLTIVPCIYLILARFENKNYFVEDVELDTSIHLQNKAS